MTAFGFLVSLLAAMANPGLWLLVLFALFVGQVWRHATRPPRAPDLESASRDGIELAIAQAKGREAYYLANYKPLPGARD